MSAYKTIECSFKDKNTLIESLKHIGYHPVVYKSPHNLSGYMNDKRTELANIIVPKSQISKASNDLGFLYDEENQQYNMICSDYDVFRGVADKVKQSYALIAIKSALKKNKFTINSETKDPTILISVQKII